jgi:hypothetical protein
MTDCFYRFDQSTYSIKAIVVRAANIPGKHLNAVGPDTSLTDLDSD